MMLRQSICLWGKTMKNKEKLNILILCGLLFLSACGASDESQADEENEISMEEPEEETNEVNIILYVDGSGRICEITTDISVEPARLGRIEKGILPNGLFDDDYNEQIIKDGSPCHEDMVWDFERHFRRLMYPDEVYEQDNEGMFASGYACVSAEKYLV